MEPPEIISFGEVLWDIFPDGERFGGSPANFACQATVQGAAVTIVSAVGNDIRGQEAVAFLERYGINVNFLQTIPDAPTGTVGIEVDSQGKPTFEIHQDSAWDRLEWDDKFDLAIKSADAVYFGTLGQRSATARDSIRRAMSVACDAGVTRLLDINIRPPFIDGNLIRESISNADILKLSDDELAPVCSALGIETNKEPDAILEKLRQSCGLDVIVMTCGADGALAVSEHEAVRQVGIPTTVVDTVGAGDSFAATFLLGLLSKRPLDESLRIACEVAAASCAHEGAVPTKATND